MRFSDLATQITLPTLAVILHLVLSPSVRADSILPTGSFYCEGAPGPALCSGNGSQLPSVNGIEGVEMNFSGNGEGIQYAIIGDLSGDSLAAGTLIPYSFSLNATSIDPAGTEITGYSFSPQAVASFPPDFNVPPPFIGASVSQTATVLQDGNCAPLPSGPGNTCWLLSITGTGFFEFSSSTVPSGALVEIPLLVDISTESLGGIPEVSISGTLDLNPVPEPRCLMLIVLGCGLVFMFGRRVRRLALSKCANR